MNTRIPAADGPVANVLIVDDVEQNLLALEALLARPGLRILKAKGGDEALELLLAHDVGVALLDVQMPEMDGYELAELMRGAERTCNVPIIFITAAHEDRLRSFRGYEAGAVDFLYKPVDPHVLTSKVSVFVELSRQRARLQERMRELERIIKLNEMMSAVLTHDLRTPLSAILLSAEVVMRRAPDDATRQAGRRIKDSGARMARLIDQLLDLARLRSGLLRVDPRPNNLLAVCEAAVAEIRQAAPDAAIEVRASGTLDGAWDADRLLQVVSNLVMNAMQHGEQGRPVELALDGSDRDMVRLRVSNEGAIPEQARTHLFEPFHGGRGSASGGLGLGLYIVDQFVRAHGGTVEARPDGSRTVFEVRLPRGPAPRPPAPAADR